MTKILLGDYERFICLVRSIASLGQLADETLRAVATTGLDTLQAGTFPSVGDAERAKFHFGNWPGRVDGALCRPVHPGRSPARRGAIALPAVHLAKTGKLFYDADGPGGVDHVQIALLTGKPALTAADIEIA